MPDAVAALSHWRFRGHQNWLLPATVSTASGEPARHLA